MGDMRFAYLRKPDHVMYYLAWLFIAIIYAPVFHELYGSRWETIDYTHAYFVLPVSLWVVWKKREILRDRSFQSTSRHWDIFSLTAVCSGLLMFLFGWRQEFLSISTLSLIPVLWGVTAYLYGIPAVKTLSFPILFLLFLVPPPLGVLDSVTLPMRYGISAATETLLRMLGYPITRIGLLLSMDGREIFMGAPCSGFRSLITLFALAVAYVYFVGGSWRKRLALIGAAVPLALFGNLLRVTALCLVTYYAGQKAAQGFFHELSGVLIFLIMILGLMGLESWIERPQKNPDEF
ncbi:MAG: exosortase/archaeosortase family protein [Candidatus Omnitrophica bacterium]|nr:exosortase/archaeosortase family protein [Candidatus Omnitrophota bacterium]